MRNPLQVYAKIRELRAKNIPHCTFADVFKVEEGSLTSEEIILMDTYLVQFSKPGDGCISCGEKQGGDMIDRMMGRAKFEWGLTHGQGHCSKCGWPARAYHYNPTPWMQRFNAILQIHPDYLVIPEDRQATEPPAATTTPTTH